MNKYRLPQDAYNRRYDKEISREEIHQRLVGEKTKEIIDKRCKECKKDWTKCGRCPVTMEWVKEQKTRRKL